MTTRIGMAAVVVALLIARSFAQAPQNTREAHCAAARAAAGTEHASLFNRFADICSPGAASASQAGRGAGAQPPERQVPVREMWYHPPAKVFDNLYFVGTKIHNAWAIQTSEGLIVVDALYDYAVKESVVDGLRKLGLNPGTMKYLIISHGHGDHHGGAKFLQDEFGPRVVMGGPDWTLVENNKRDPSPKRDVVATNGQKITLGDTTVTLHHTPGHTAGTFSLVIPVKDNGRPHLLATWGGTALSRNTPVAALKEYVDSAVRYRELLKTLGVQGMISNHSEFDRSTGKLEELARRKAGDRHPFLTGADSVHRYMTVVEEVGRAAMAASAASQ